MEKNSLFQFLIENAIEIVIVFNSNGKIVCANCTARTQLEYGEELCGNMIDEIFPGGIALTDGILSIHSEGSEVNDAGQEMHHLIAYRKNRTCFPTKVRVLTFEDAFKLPGDWAGERIYVCTAYNATNENFLEKKATQAEQEIEEAQKIKSEFVANVTHELRTPVNGILGNTQELLDLETEPKKLKLLNLVERGCRDMNAIINNILDFSKLEAGKFVLEPSNFHFPAMIDYVKSNHTKRIVEKGLGFSITVSPEIPECVVGDELRIVQVLNNLISNAYKFTSVGEIHVEVVKTAQSGRRVELFFMVIDTGIGIAKADQDKLFKSFSQVDASISRKYGGTGLGLNICKQLVELMGGDIHVDSELGRGTTFSFHIWVEVPEDEYEPDRAQDYTADFDQQALMRKLQSLTEGRVSDKIWTYGEPENKEEIEKKLSKLTLSVEMENWEKAEIFTETIRQLVEQAPREVKSAALRLKMAIQKGDYDKAITALKTLQEII